MWVTFYKTVKKVLYDQFCVVKRVVRKVEFGQTYSVPPGTMELVINWKVLEVTDVSGVQIVL